jgi:hypothetical protein
MSYTKTTWQEGITPLSPSNLNKIEQGIADAHTDILTVSDTHQYKSYTSITQINLIDSQFSTTDFSANIVLLLTTLGYHATLYAYISDTIFPNLKTSLATYLTSLGYPVVTDYVLRIISTGNTSVPNEIVIRPNNSDFLFVATYDNSLRGFTDITGKANAKIQMTLNSITKDIVKAVGNGPSSSGMGIVIGAGGTVVIGSGESHDAITTASVVTGQEETLFLGSDNNIEFYTGANSGIASAKNFGLDTTALITTEKKFINKAINELASGSTTIVLYNGLRQYLKADADGLYLQEV